MRQWLLLAAGLLLVVATPVAATAAILRPFGPDAEYRDLLRLDLGIGLAVAAGAALVGTAVAERVKRWRPVWDGDAFTVPPPRLDTDRLAVAIAAASLLTGGLVSGALVAFHTAQHLFGSPF